VRRINITHHVNSTKLNRSFAPIFASGTIYSIPKEENVSSRTEPNFPSSKHKKIFLRDRGQAVARHFGARVKKRDVVPTFGICGGQRKRVL
jgi:hypothetical protein